MKSFNTEEIKKEENSHFVSELDFTSQKGGLE